MLHIITQPENFPVHGENQSAIHRRPFEDLPRDGFAMFYEPSRHQSRDAGQGDLAAQLGYVHMEMRAPTRARPKKRPVVGVLVCTSVKDYLEENSRVRARSSSRVSPSLPCCTTSSSICITWTRTRVAGSSRLPENQKSSGAQMGGGDFDLSFPDRVVGALLPRFPWFRSSNRPTCSSSTAWMWTTTRASRWRWTG